MDVRRRRWAVVGAGALGLLLAVGAGAFACVNLATLSLSSTSGPAGARITASGSGYSTTAPIPPVVLRWNGTEGPELAQVVPDRRGGFTVSFVIPHGAPGYYVVLAVHRDAKGVDRYGTPARASYQILGPGQAAPTTPTTTVRTTTSTIVVRTTTSTSTTPSTSTTSTTSTTTAPVAAVPVLPVASRDDEPEDLPAAAVVSGALLLAGVTAALRVTARRQSAL